MGGGRGKFSGPGSQEGPAKSFKVSFELLLIVTMLMNVARSFKRGKSNFGSFKLK